MQRNKVIMRHVRRETYTREDVFKLLRDQFALTKPAYQLYMEIFEMKQSDHEESVPFICQRFALLAISIYLSEHPCH